MREVSTQLPSGCNEVRDSNDLVMTHLHGGVSGHVLHRFLCQIMSPTETSLARDPRSTKSPQDLEIIIMLSRTFYTVTSMNAYNV